METGIRNWISMKVLYTTGSTVDYLLLKTIRRRQSEQTPGITIRSSRSYSTVGILPSSSLISGYVSHHLSSLQLVHMLVC
jgi:hypothetical protein